jgi:type II secretory pathway pseudopilin PulG
VKFEPQSGIAIGPIIFVVAVLAVLAVAIAAGSQSYTGGTGTETANTQAAAIMHQADDMATAVQRVFVEHSCSPSQINFSNPIVTNYTNPNAPSDNSCDVFNPNGGSINYEIPEQAWLDSSFSGLAWYGKWFITGGTCINSVGSAPASGCQTTSTDYPILLILPFVQQSVCNAIVQKVSANCSINSSSGNEYLNSRYFSGSFISGVRLNGDDGLPAGSPCLMEGCAIETGSGFNPPINAIIYYKVLLAQ